MAITTLESEQFTTLLSYFEKKVNTATVTVTSKRQEKIDANLKAQEKKGGTPILLDKNGGQATFFIHDPEEALEIKSVHVNPTHRIDEVSNRELDQILDSISTEKLKVYLQDIAVFLLAIAPLLSSLESQYLRKKATEYEQTSQEDILFMLGNLNEIEVLTLHNEILSLMNMVRALYTIQTGTDRKTQQTLSIPILLHFRRRLQYYGITPPPSSRAAADKKNSLTP